MVRVDSDGIRLVFQSKYICSACLLFVCLWQILDLVPREDDGTEDNKYTYSDAECVYGS